MMIAFPYLDLQGVVVTRSGWILAAALSVAGMVSPAHAVDFNLTTPTSSTSGYAVNTGISGIGTISNIGNSLTYVFGSGANKLSLRATAYSYNPSTGLLNSAAINIFGKSNGYDQDYGLGIQDQFEKATSPNHSIDNLGVIDFIVLQFDKAVNFTSFNIGWASNDSDTTVSWLNAGYGALNLDGKAVSALTALTLGSVNLDVNGAVLGARDVSIPVVSTVVISARSGSDADKKADYFKVNSVTATAAVPEPSTWAMMLGGFGAIGFAMRRRPRKIASLA